MYLKICPLQFWVPNVVAKGPYLVPISWKRTVATWVPMGTLFSCWVPIGSPFLFQGPHFLYLGLRDACKFNGDSISSQCLINCDNTISSLNESHACLSVKSLQHSPKSSSCPLPLASGTSRLEALVPGEEGAVGEGKPMSRSSRFSSSNIGTFFSETSILFALWQSCSLYVQDAESSLKLEKKIFSGRIWHLV